jgi:hypothetical protein
MAKHYSEKEVADWNTNDFIAYLSDEHQRRFNVDYQPFGTWASERGQLGNWIGTRKKVGKYGAEFTKRFIDLCMADYKPTRDYPGVSWGFMVAYMKANIQRLQVEAMRGQAAVADDAGEIDDDWL